MLGTLNLNAVKISGTALQHQIGLWVNDTDLQGSASFTFDGTNLYLSGLFGIGVASPTAFLHLPAGTADSPPLKITEGVATTAAEKGAIEYHNDRMYITNVSTRRAIDRTNDVILETTTVADTVTETTIYTGNIGAGDLKAGNILKLHANGVLSTATAADDITIRVYLGASEVLAFNPAIGNVTNAHWHIDGDMTVRTVGAGGTMAYHLDALISASETYVIGTDSVNTTITENFTVTVEWDNAKAGNTISIYQGYTEWKN